jgi:hypothetical protein
MMLPTHPKCQEIPTWIRINPIMEIIDISNMLNIHGSKWIYSGASNKPK